MKLLRYRVTDFRSVVDSGWIETDQVTALIGVNESGKTNLLLPLWKLSPAREGEIRPTSDYPKSKYAEIREEPTAFDFIDAEFDCSELSTKLAELTSVPTGVLGTVRVRRDYAGGYTVEFPGFTPKRTVASKETRALLATVTSDIEGMVALAKEATTKPELLAAVKRAHDTYAAEATLQAVHVNYLSDMLKKAVPEAPAATSTIVPRLQQAADQLKAVAAGLQIPAPGTVAAAKKLVVDALPRFVYYSNYGNLDSEIYLPHVVQNLKREDLGQKEAAKARTLRVLFSFVRLQAEQILELGRDYRDTPKPTDAQIAEIAENKRERTILLHSAGTDLTKKFKDWWRQGDYTFEFQADGDHFRIWVSDSKRPEKIELEDRSSGLQWFLSFYLIFLVESARDHKNAILLLDEPGLSLHPLAQGDLSAFFESLSKTNQLLYTTHSPFLVDADMLDRVRAVYVDTDGSTKATTDLRRGTDDPRKAGASYAVYSALNMNVAESLLFGCHPVVVEGPSDQLYLTAIKTILISAKKISPKREIVFPPSHGANNAKVVASILTGRDETLPVMLLDGDEAGRKMATDLQNGLYQQSKDRVHVTNEFVAFNDSEIEDLFPPKLIVEAVDRIHRSADIPFTDAYKDGSPIVPQIENWATSQSIALSQGWKVDLAREVKRRLLQGGVKKVEAEVLDGWSKLFAPLLPAE